jgi:hypothetical protein
MSDHDRSLDLMRTLEALLSTASAGRAVARALSEQAAERQDRTVIADLRARRAEHLRDTEMDAEEGRRMGETRGVPSGRSPWSRSA